MNLYVIYQPRTSLTRPFLFNLHPVEFELALQIVYVGLPFFFNISFVIFLDQPTVLFMDAIFRWDSLIQNSLLLVFILWVRSFMLIVFYWSGLHLPRFRPLFLWPELKPTPPIGFEKIGPMAKLVGLMGLWAPTIFEIKEFLNKLFSLIFSTF